MTWDLDTYRSLLDKSMAATGVKKGPALETFLEYVFTSFEGVSLLGRDLRSPSQELDLVLWNDQLSDYFRSASSEVIIEAKNWDAPVGSGEVSWFLQKLLQRGVTHGFLVAAHGVTGATRDRSDGAVDSLYQSLQHGTRPVVLTYDELDVMTSLEDLTQLFKQKCCKLLLKQVV